MQVNTNKMVTDAKAPESLLEPLQFGDVALHLTEFYTADISPWAVPAYRFDIVAGGVRSGTISLRLGTTRTLTHLAGQVGFSVNEASRGRGIAGKGVTSLLPLACAHNMNPFWFTTTPENVSSRRTLEKLGCEFIEIVRIPEQYESNARGERYKLRYRLFVSAA